MHEHGIARDLWKTALLSAKENNLSKITKIIISLGAAAGAEKDFLDHSFKDHIFKENEIAKDAVVEYEITPLCAVCNVCKTEIKPSDMATLSCPVCKSNDIKISSGRDIYVKSIEGE